MGGGLVDAGSSDYSSFYEQSDPNDLADDIVMTLDRFVFCLL